MHKTIRQGLRFSTALLALGLVAACADKDEDILQGERIPLHQSDSTGATLGPSELRPLGPSRANADWTQAGGNSAHAMGVLAGPAGTPSKIWSRSIGNGFANRLPADGVIYGENKIFARDGEDGVVAIDPSNGKVLWRQEIGLEDEDTESAYGGGVAYDAGLVFANTGHGLVIALNASDGSEAWRQQYNAPFRSSPVVLEGNVTVMTADNVVYMMNARTGARKWRYTGPIDAGGGVAVGTLAAVPGAVIAPFNNGELAVIRATNGQKIWSSPISFNQRGAGLAAFPGITSDPVVVGNVVIAGNAGAHISAYEGRSGRQIWSRNFGSLTATYPVGDSLYVVASLPQLSRLDTRTGRTIWAVDLDGYEDADDLSGVINYGGPVVAGGKVWITSSDGMLLTFDAVNGTALDRIELSGGSSTGPIVANSVVYVLSDNGTLQAFK